MSDYKTMQPQPSELDVAALRASLADLRKKLADREVENDDLYRELDAMREHRTLVRRLFMDLHRVLESYKSPVTDADAKEAK